MSPPGLRARRRCWETFARLRATFLSGSGIAHTLPLLDSARWPRKVYWNGLPSFCILSWSCRNSVPSRLVSRRYVVLPKTVRMSPFRTSRLATTPQLFSVMSIPRTCETRSSSLRGMLLLQVQSFVHARSILLFHSHALTDSLFANRWGGIRHLWEVLVGARSCSPPFPSWCGPLSVDSEVGMIVAILTFLAALPVACCTFVLVL